MQKLILTVAAIGSTQAEVFGMKDSCKETIPKLWGELLDQIEIDIKNGTDANSTVALQAYAKEFPTTCKFNGNETNIVTEEDLMWPEKSTWNMTCDDKRKLILARDELNVFKSFGKGSLKDPLWKAWWDWDDVIFGKKCVAKYYHAEKPEEVPLAFLQ